MDDSLTVPIRRPMHPQTEGPQGPNRKWGDDLDYRSLFEQTGECVFIIDLDFHYLAANQQALSLLGYEEDELIGMPVSRVIALGDVPGQDTMLSDGASLQERTLKRKDGVTLPVEISTSMVYGADGVPAYIQSIARDISERKHSEQMLKRYNEILSVISAATVRLLRSSSNEAVIPEMLESLGRALGVSGAAIFQIHAFAEEPAVHMQFQWEKDPALEFAHAVEGFIAPILSAPDGYFAVNRSDSSSGLSFVTLAIDGTLGSWGLLGLFDEADSLAWSPLELDAVHTAANLIGAALQRLRFEETIHLSETRNRIILSAMPDLLIRIDSQGRILDYTANPDHPLYIDRDAISGKELAQTWPPEMVQQIIGAENAESFQTPHALMEFRLPFSNRIYESRLHPIRTTEALIIIRDITDEARLSQMKSDFINRASHELRTPLTTAMLMTELIRGGGTPEELEQYWQTLASELDRQKNLIDSLLMAGRLESGMMKLEVVPLDLPAVLEDSARAIRPVAGHRGIAIELTMPELPPQVLGDKAGLQQVFINLINNAVKFSPKGCAVEVKLSLTGEWACVAIADHGLGIPPEAVPHLFERFYRARNVSVAEIPGSGIGLYIVKSIVEELGGNISVESTLGQGTRFTVNLRRADTAG